MSSDEMSVKKKTEKTLRNINEVTLKIKRELGLINELIRDKGDLPVAAQKANDALISIAKKQGIKSLDELLRTDEDSQEDERALLGRLSLESVDQTLSSIADG